MASSHVPRLILYHQTTHDSSDKLISILPLVTTPAIALSHLIIAAIHINDDPDALTLNDLPPSHPRFASTWAELRIAQASGIKVLGMLGGAAKGSYTRLDSDLSTFERYYQPLHALITERSLDGLDLDVEEHMSLAGIIRLIDRLRADFGPSFLITLAPVAAALLDSRRNLSGFDYEALEVMRGSQIAWYNAQFYCGWGDASTPVMYNMCLARGWPADKIVMGLVTTPANGAGWVPFEILGPNLQLIKQSVPSFGGVMGWEYFNSKPGDAARPWEWAERMTSYLGRSKSSSTKASVAAASAKTELDPDKPEGDEPVAPDAFEYHSDGLGDDS
ncbi:Glycosyl hydrolases family 18 [Microdochium nivale]|nr:Glycosyl hydrolases family 18 [Microdochium nivale]